MQITEKLKNLFLWEGEGVAGGGAPSEQSAQETLAPTGEVPPPPAPEPAPVAAPPAWATARIGELTAKRREAEEALAEANRRAAELEARLAAQGQGNVPPAPVAPPQGRVYTQAEVQAEAQRLAAEAQYNDLANRIYHTGQSKFPDFANAITVLNAAFGSIPREFVEAANETGKPEELIYALSKDLNKASEILSSGSPTKLAAATMRFATESLGAPPAKPGAPAASNVPPPISPMVSGGSSVSPSIDNPNLSMEEFMRIRNEQTRAARR